MLLRSPPLPRAVSATRGVDETEAAFALLADGLSRNLAGALVTLTGFSGGSPRERGAHMAVLESGEYCGYVSGGCVEAALAAETLGVIAGETTTILRFGEGSPFLDVRLPCGGGIDVLISSIGDPAPVTGVLDALRQRDPFSLHLSRAGGLTLAGAGGPTEWIDADTFRRAYAPCTRLVLLGRGPELEALSRLALGAGLDVVCLVPDPDKSESVSAAGAVVQTLSTQALTESIDAASAVATLFHDHDEEPRLLATILEQPAFFVGALGSRQTHLRRCEALRALGVSDSAIARIQAPIGAFGPARDPATLAISILAQIAALRPIGR